MFGVNLNLIPQSTLYSMLLEQLSHSLDFNHFSPQPGFPKSNFAQLLQLTGREFPEELLEDWGYWGSEVRPQLEVTEQAQQEMLQERETKVQNHTLDSTLLDLNQDGVASNGVGDGQLVAIQDGAAIDTDMAISEGKEILERFMNNQESTYKEDIVATYDKDGNPYSTEWVKQQRIKAHDKAVLDNNGDGVLSAEEMSDGLQNSTLGGGRRRLMVWSDANGDGKIQASELAAPGALADPLPGRTRSLEIARDGKTHYGNAGIHARTVLHNEKYSDIDQGNYRLVFEGERSPGFILRALRGQLTEADYDMDHNREVDELERRLIGREVANLRYRFDANHDGTVSLEELEKAGARVKVGREKLTLSEFQARYPGVRLDPQTYTFDISQLPTSPDRIDAGQIRDQVGQLIGAMDGWGTDEEKLCQILIGRTPEEIDALKAEYRRRQGRSLEDDVADETSGDLKASLLQALRSGATADAPNFDAKHDAEILYEAVDGWGTDEAAIFNVLRNRSQAQIEQIKTAYREKYGESLYDALDGDLSGDDWDLAKKYVG